MKISRVKTALVATIRWFLAGVVWLVVFVGINISLGPIVSTPAQVWKWFVILFGVMTAASLASWVSPIRPRKRFMFWATLVPALMFIITSLVCDEACRELVR